MGHGLKKSERLRKMEQLYCQRGFTDQELAVHLGVTRQTIFRDRIELEAELGITIEKDAEGRYRIHRSQYLSSIRVNLPETVQLYLAARRASQQTRSAQQSAASSLEKLALSLKQPMTQRLVKAASTILERRANPLIDKVFEAAARAWVDQSLLRIRYRGLDSDEAYPDVLAIYLIEPSPWSDSVYLIGHSDRLGKIVAYRLDRIEHVFVSGETYTLPDDYDEDELLRYAWGIWRSNKDPDTVRLRFRSGRAAKRLQESVWHPLETVTTLENGDLLWAAPIAEPREMLPWVRGWGADVEVVEPDWLRGEVKREARRLGELYEISSMSGATRVYYAHSRQDTDETEWQLLKDHLVATGEIAFELGRDAKVSQLAQMAALLHDIGKYSDTFQARLRGSKRPVDHATAGAREVMALFPNPPHRDIADLLSYCIAGHHSGLPDYGSMGDVETDGTLLARREKKKLEDYSAYKSETEIDLSQMQSPRIKPSRFRFGDREKPYPGFSVAFLTRMIFSTLVDADWLDTERFMSGEKPRGQYASIEALAQEFERYMQRFANPQSSINRKRTETLHVCIAKADHKPGFFTLTVPTGGAKTLTSMAFALKHALAHGMKRIIYVIPFTSIIEQNAAVFREALGPLGEENILEHHSNLDWEQLRQDSDHEGESAYEKLRLAAENWDIPIVVTTNVQFFESLFANKKSRSRKLHNIANSVIIFDEVQMLPRDFLKPCLLAVSELVQNYGTSVVLSTATQPALEKFFPAGTAITELAPDPTALFDFYRRVSVESLGTFTDEALLEKLNAHPQVLCIVNTRRHAKGLFDQLTGEGNYHLSTLMCPAHRKQVLTEIRERLGTGETCRVISTQVMEAGIDVDFPVGYRAMAGLDSIIQAAGRVNREGKRVSGQMFVFQPDTQFIKRTPVFIEQTSAVAQSTLRTFADDPTTIAAINAYYQQLYLLQDEKAFDVRQILNYFDKGTGKFDFDFKTAAENFRLIDDSTVAIIIPYNDEAIKLLETLQHTLYPVTTLRKLQPFTVNIYEREFRALQSLGAIQTIHEQYHTLDVRYAKPYYHAQTGLVLPENSSGAAVFFD